MTRRQALSLSALALPGASSSASAQFRAIVPQGVKPQKRGAASGLPFNAKFTNVAKAAGLTAPVIFGDEGHADYILDSLGCGVAFFDYDGDGWQDILLLTGRRRHAPNPADATIRLYHNNRDGTFRDVTAQSGLGRNDIWALGVTIADYDNDGFDDIFVTCYGQNILFHNNGKGTFTDVTEKAGLLHQGDRLSTGCTWIDYDRNGLLDLFVTHYVVFDPAKIPARGMTAACTWKEVPVYCGPLGLPYESSRLYRNNGDGTFTDVSDKSGISLAGQKRGASYGLTAVAADFDGDGWPDIYVACDTTDSLLFHNNRDGTFTECALDNGVAVNEDGREQEGMGLGIGDYNTDGYLDIFKTHFSDDTNVLYRNNGKGVFQDVTIRAGLGVETRFVGWGAGIEDLDNNGLPDLFYTSGMVFPEAGAKIPDAPYKTPSVLFRNLGNGKFEELLDQAGPAMNEMHSSRGLAFGDFDNDGDLDILIMNMNEPPSLLRNDRTGGDHWLKVLLEGVTSNRSAIGATVLASYGGKKQAKAVLAQSSYLSVNDRRLHFGLGSETKADLEITWPDGKKLAVPNVEADRLVVIREGAGIVRTDTFARAAR
ncbi:MAG TPA: CRTAC1 family protein [Bryobacteraceae bacterium]|nr:CRTAC1 family protein [Bryobacteraceae bacterium]